MELKRRNETSRNLKLFDKHWSILNRLILPVIAILSYNLFGNFDKFRFSSMRTYLTLSDLMSALYDRVFEKPSVFQIHVYP